MPSKKGVRKDRLCFEYKWPYIIYRLCLLREQKKEKDYALNKSDHI